MEPPTISRTRLRNLEPIDLPKIFEIQLDPESNQMAVTIPRTREAFDAFWTNALRDPGFTVKAVLFDDVVVGFVSCFKKDGFDLIGYRIDKTYWGRGIATRALELLLVEFPNRPVHAYAATSNQGSLRVLQKCGFVVESIRMSVPDDRLPQCEEAVLVLR